MTNDQAAEHEVSVRLQPAWSEWLARCSCGWTGSYYSGKGPAEVEGQRHVTTEEAQHEWTINVRRWDHYGKRVVGSSPTVVLAATRSEVTTKVRAMFEATYDDFRKFWSHDWVLVSVREVTQRPGQEPKR